MERKTKTHFFIPNNRITILRSCRTTIIIVNTLTRHFNKVVNFAEATILNKIFHKCKK